MDECRKVHIFLPLLLLSLFVYRANTEDEWLDELARLPYLEMVNRPNAINCSVVGHPILLIMVQSQPDHFEHRNILRKFLKLTKFDFWSMVFTLGQTADPLLRDKIQQEQQKYGDLLQGKFQDHYRNNTEKHLLALLWASRHCGHSKLMLKIDDNVFVDFYTLHSNIKEPSKYDEHPEELYCMRMDQQPVRNSSSKWYVDVQTYELDRYPSYCSGWAYLASTVTIKNLMRAFSQLTTKRLFWIDDVYVTGLLRIKARPTIPIANIAYLFDLDGKKLKEWLQSDNQTSWNFLFTPVSDVEMLEDAFKFNHQYNSNLENEWSIFQGSQYLE